MSIEVAAFMSGFLPTFALFYCLIYSMASDYEYITKTHCAWVNKQTNKN